MIVLGLDPGYRNFGYCIVETHNGDKDAKVLTKGTLRNGSLKEWQHGISVLLEKLDKVVAKYTVDIAAIEMISWYGKRHGSLQLAHLAGAAFGYCEAVGNIAKTMFFAPPVVKKTTSAFPTPKGFNEHEADSLSLCRLALNREAESLVADAQKTSGRSKKRS